MSIICPQCKAESDESGQFCSQCGAKLDARADSTISFTLAVEAAEEAHIDLGQLAAEGPLLVVLKGIGVGQTFPLVGDEVRIGRDPENDIFLDDITVSRQHALINTKAGGHEISDTGSLNGTYVNRKRVEAKELSDLDELQIGKFKMIFIDRHGAKHGE